MAEESDNHTDPTNSAPAADKAPENAKESQELPDWATKELASVRAEAARYRTEKNAAVEEARAETLAAHQTEKSELESELSKSERNLLRLRIAVGAAVPADKIETFAERLQGDSEDDLRADADKLKAMFSTPEAQSQSAVDHSQGSGNHLPLNGDPLLNALKSKVGVR